MRRNSSQRRCYRRRSSRRCWPAAAAGPTNSCASRSFAGRQRPGRRRARAIEDDETRSTPIGRGRPRARCADQSLHAINASPRSATSSPSSSRSTTRPRSATPRTVRRRRTRASTSSLELTQPGGSGSQRVVAVDAVPDVGRHLELVDPRPGQHRPPGTNPGFGRRRRHRSAAQRQSGHQRLAGSAGELRIAPAHRRRHRAALRHLARQHDRLRPHRRGAHLLWRARPI